MESPLLDAGRSRSSTGCSPGLRGTPEDLERLENLEAEANAVYHSNHRGVLRGKEVGDNEVREILRESGDDGLRREAWEASKTVGPAR